MRGGPEQRFANSVCYRGTAPAGAAEPRAPVPVPKLLPPSTGKSRSHTVASATYAESRPPPQLAEPLVVSRYGDQQAVGRVGMCLKRRGKWCTGGEGRGGMEG